MVNKWIRNDSIYKTIQINVIQLYKETKQIYAISIIIQRNKANLHSMYNYTKKQSKFMQYVQLYRETNQIYTVHGNILGHWSNSCKPWLATTKNWPKKRKKNHHPAKQIVREFSVHRTTTKKKIWTKEKNALTVLRFPSFREGSSTTDCPWILCTYKKKSLPVPSTASSGKYSCRFINVINYNYFSFPFLHKLWAYFLSPLFPVFISRSMQPHQKIVYFFASQCESRDRLDQMMIISNTKSTMKIKSGRLWELRHLTAWSAKCNAQSTVKSNHKSLSHRSGHTMFYT